MPNYPPMMEPKSYLSSVFWFVSDTIVSFGELVVDDMTPEATGCMRKRDPAPGGATDGTPLAAPPLES